MSRSQRADLYQQVTDRIVADLEGGTIPWVQPWGNTGSGPAMPHNVVTKHRYSGINVLLLWGALLSNGFASQRWLTFNQAKASGGTVRKGEKGTTIFYASQFIPKDQKGCEDPRAISYLKCFSVFNVEQCDGLPGAMTERQAAAPETVAIPVADDLIRATGAEIRIGGDRACYIPSLDLIELPPKASFFAPIDWYRTATHELGHWSGSEKRLARDLSNRFGTYGYMAEELVAELTSAFCLSHLGINPTVRHADYCGAWIDMLKADRRAIFTAARLASAAADYLLAFAAPSPPEAVEAADLPPLAA